MRNSPFTMRLAILGGMLVALIVSISIYRMGYSQYSFASATPAGSTALTNPSALLNWMPASSYQYTLARINDYLRANNTGTVTMTVQGSVTFDTSTYDFTLQLNPSTQTLPVVVTVTNNGGILSTRVSINGQDQTPSIAPAASGTAAYTGIDGLINNGISALQVNEMEQALRSFDPSANNINIDSSSISLGQVSSDGFTQPYTFIMIIDHKQYNATLDAIGLLQSQLFLRDPNSHNRQVFDSGVLSQGS